jgi:hypothetical protein
MNRRIFLTTTAQATVASLAALTTTGCRLADRRLHPAKSQADANQPLSSEGELIRKGARTALDKYLYPSLLDRIYPGHFIIAPDGCYGTENTWPGLDSWQIAGAYLLVGRQRVVLDYFDFVEASQRKDGNIPFAIFPGEQSPGSLDSWLRGLRFPEDVYTYTPRSRAGRPPNITYTPRKWIGLFRHWQINVNPLSDLGALSYILTASEIFASTRDLAWLKEKLASLTAAASYVYSRKSPNGLIAGAGFYIESPPRNQWDGVTQCYAIYSFRLLASIQRAAGRRREAREWNSRAQTLADRFEAMFWRRDHYGEYVHPEHGLVDFHGLSDVNWAAIGLGVATGRQCRVLWPLLTSESAFWRGDMPTHLVTKPGTYEKWEFQEPLPFPYAGYTHDVAAMGRVWYLEALACKRMGASRRLRDSVIKVCAMGKRNNWVWYERYHAGPNDTVKVGGHGMYCEYPAILIRIVLTNPALFPEAAGLF